MRSSPAHLFALVGGAVYVLGGIIGFAITGVTGFAENSDKALLVFDINPFHNVVHLGIGAFLIGASRVKGPDVTAGIVIGSGIVLLLATALGALGALDNLLSIDDRLAADNFLHLGTAIAAIAIGSLPGESVSRDRDNAIRAT